METVGHLSAKLACWCADLVAVIFAVHYLFRRVRLVLVNVNVCRACDFVDHL